MKSTSTVTSTSNLNYKKGYVQCACGWRKELGDGFNGYHIDCCPNCNTKLETRVQNQVVIGPWNKTTTFYGVFKYFVLSNGIHIQYYRYVNKTR